MKKGCSEMDTNDIQEGTPLQVTVLGHSESREIVRVGNTLAVGALSSKLVLAFPQTHKDIPPKTFIVDVPPEVVEEYADCQYDLYREAHPELNLPVRVFGAPLPTFIKTP